MKKRIVSAIIAAALLIMQAVPAFSVGSFAPKYATPEGYNENDYQKAVAFMETEDEYGVKNGEKIVSFFNGYYRPNDPESWAITTTITITAYCTFTGYSGPTTRKSGSARSSSIIWASWASSTFRACRNSARRTAITTG